MALMFALTFQFITVGSAKMKLLAVAVVTSCFLFAACTAHSDQFQYNSCVVKTDRCTSLFSGYKYSINNLSQLASQLLDQSWDFLLLSSAFSQYHKDRPGFRGLYRSISDQAWADAIEVIKYQAKRGHSGIPLAGDSNTLKEHRIRRVLSDPRRADEFSSLQQATEYEKLVSSEAQSLQKRFSYIQGPTYDADVAHFLDDKIIKPRMESIRKLVGLGRILDGIWNGERSTKELGLHQFDEQLQGTK